MNIDPACGLRLDDSVPTWLRAADSPNPGRRADQIAKALHTDPHTMRLPMQALMAAKKVKTQGQRRGTKYYVAGAAPAAAKPMTSKKRVMRRGKK